MKNEKLFKVLGSVIIFVVVVGFARAGLMDDIMNSPEDVNLFDGSSGEDDEGISGDINLFDGSAPEDSTDNSTSGDINLFDGSAPENSGSDPSDINLFDGSAPENSSCTDTTWTPDRSTVCRGSSFVQTSNCGNTRTVTGTKTCGGGGGGGGGGGRTTYECNDGADNDGDGLIDFPDDPGCSHSRDDTEDTDKQTITEPPVTPTKPSAPSNRAGNKTGAVCDDGLDNDGDGLIDFPEDPDCRFRTDTSEGEPPKPAAPVEIKLHKSGPESEILAAVMVLAGGAVLTLRKKRGEVKVK